MTKSDLLKMMQGYEIKTNQLILRNEGSWCLSDVAYIKNNTIILQTKQKVQLSNTFFHYRF